MMNWNQKLVSAKEIIDKKHVLYVGMGNNKKATEELEKLVKFYPSNLDYYHNLAEFYLRINEGEKANEVYQRILDADPNDARATIAIAGNQKEGNTEVAYLNSLTSIFQNPEVKIDVKVKELIPYIHKVANSGDVELGKSIIALAEILEEFHSDNAKTYSLFGDILYYTGNVEASLEKYEKDPRL